jgi:hypothetical protein
LGLKQNFRSVKLVSKFPILLGKLQLYPFLNAPTSLACTRSGSASSLPEVIFRPFFHSVTCVPALTISPASAAIEATKHMMTTPRDPDTVRIAREREHFVGRHAQFREPCGTAQSPAEVEPPNTAQHAAAWLAQRVLPFRACGL